MIKQYSIAALQKQHLGQIKNLIETQEMFLIASCDGETHTKVSEALYKAKVNIMAAELALEEAIKEYYGLMSGKSE